MNIYQHCRAVGHGEWRVGCLCGWGEDRGNWFLTKCVLDLIQLLHFSLLLYLHRNHLRWVNFRGQPICEKIQSFSVRPVLNVWVCVCVSKTPICMYHKCVFGWMCFSWVLTCAVAIRCPCEASTVWARALNLSSTSSVHSHIRSAQFLLTLSSEGKHSDDSQYPRQHSSVNI